MSHDENSGFTSHLAELRKRLINSFIFLIAFFVLCYFFAEHLYGFLVEPYAKAVKDDGTERRLIFTALQETFLTYLKISFFAAFFVTCPFILIQIWKFIAPGLYKHEKIAILPYLILTPLLLQRNATNEIFRILNFNVFESAIFNDQFLIILLCLSFLSSLYISNKKNTNLKGIMIMDFSSLIILNFFLTPILAFTLYFCFLHSVRHSITLIFELDKSFKTGLKKFINRAIPLTFVTGLIFLLAIYFLNNFYKLDEAIYKVIFIGLASLTFPHILLEYLLEKNEKRT